MHLVLAPFIILWRIGEFVWKTVISSCEWLLFLWKLRHEIRK